MTTNVPWLALWSDCLWSSCCSPLTERRPRPARFAQQGVSIKHEMKYQLRLYTGHNSLLTLVLLGTLLIFLNKILDPLVRIGSWAILFGSGNIDPRYIGSPVEHEISMFGCLTTLLFSEENPGDVLHNSFSTLDFFGTCDRLVVHGVVSDFAPPDLIWPRPLCVTERCKLCNLVSKFVSSLILLSCSIFLCMSNSRSIAT